MPKRPLDGVAEGVAGLLPPKRPPALEAGAAPAAPKRPAGLGADEAAPDWAAAPPNREPPVVAAGAVDPGVAEAVLAGAALPKSPPVAGLAVSAGAPAGVVDGCAKRLFAGVSVEGVVLLPGGFRPPNSAPAAGPAVVGVVAACPEL